MRAEDAYRRGYEKGKQDNLASNAGEALLGILKDDPGGFFASGYNDGASGKRFSPPANEARKPAPELNPLDGKVAVNTLCPNCGALDWFEWKFLGKLTDPVCGCSWYAGSSLYTVRQVNAVFEMAGRFVKYMNHGVSGEGA